ncbi:hypothetical protein [Bradyrhizobium sp.]|jgi:hypothetical protein|uniref:hypothetical protein n=1 Tax=Bradyrhizobium sp. TaxID=376 RepID=UPI003C18E25C
MSDQTEAVVLAEDQIRDDHSRVSKARLRSHHLVELLVAYVSETDAGLPRDQFLRLVINRIVDELSAPLPRSR